MCPSIVSDLVKSPKPEFIFDKMGACAGACPTNQKFLHTTTTTRRVHLINNELINNEVAEVDLLLLGITGISGSYNKTHNFNSSSTVDHVLALNLKSSSWRNPSHGVQPNTTKHEHSPTPHSPINPTMHFLHTEDGTPWTAAAADRGSRIE